MGKEKGNTCYRLRACSYRHRRGKICEGIEPKGGICEMELEGPGKRTGLGGMRCV